MVASPVPAGTASRWARMRASMTPAEWRRAALLAAAIVGLHVVGIGLLLGVGYARGGVGHHRLHARPAPRVRRRPHRRHRQHHAQADEARASGRSRSASSSRSATRASSSRLGAGWGRRRGAGRRGRDLRVDGLLVRPAVSGTFLLLSRRAQPGRARGSRDLRRMRADLRRGRARGSAPEPRPAQPIYGARRARSRSRGICTRWALVRARVRHRDRGRAARCSPAPPAAAASRSTRSSACPSCSPRGCRCSTRSTARS